MRAARPTDAAAIADVHLESWRQTYAHLLSPAFFAAQDVSAREQMWRRVLDRHSGGVHVAEAGGAVVGFAAVRADDAGPRDLELRMLYLLADRHGSGAGQALLDAAVGDRQAFCWVAEENPRALAFYRRNGFHPDGAREVVTDWEGLVEVRLVR